MVNGVNSVVNFKELETQNAVKELSSVISVIKNSETAKDAEVYLSKYDKSVKWCYRRKVGTYPKFLLSPARKFLHFCFNHFTHHRIEIIARGRGKRAAFAKADKIYQRIYDQDLPLRHAKKVAVYISIIKR